MSADAPFPSTDSSGGRVNIIHSLKRCGQHTRTQIWWTLQTGNVTCCGVRLPVPTDVRGCMLQPDGRNRRPQCHGHPLASATPHRLENLCKHVTSSKILYTCATTGCNHALTAPKTWRALHGDDMDRPGENNCAISLRISKISSI